MSQHQPHPNRRWTVDHVPAADTQATITQPAPGQGRRLVVTGIDVQFVAGSAAPTATVRTVSLIAGVTGGATFLKRWKLGVVATAGATNGFSRPCQIIAPANTAVTLEFASAGGSNTEQVVSMDGYILDDADKV